MKRGMDEKSMGPMFPRLHVNNTEKGGPRAPPRNKMALYEQLSIPSQRHSGNPSSTANYTPTPSSSSQGPVNERVSFFPLQQTPLMQAADKANIRYSDLNNQLVQQEQKKNQEDEEFSIFAQQSGVNLERSRNHQKKDDEGHTSCSSVFSGGLTNVHKSRERNNYQDLVKSASKQLCRESNKVQLKETNGSSSFGHRNTSNNSIRLQNNGNSPDHVVDSQANKDVRSNRVSNEAIRNAGYVNSLLPINEVEQEGLRSPNDPINGDTVSETSMVDSMPGTDISPDDVVGMIGQKHFWKARRAIINQQRVFAVQVFELHRLIKVQRLIAELPLVVVEEEVYMGKPAKVPPIKKIPVDHALKSSINAPKLIDYHEKPKDDKQEFSAENAVEMGSHSSVQNSSRSTFSVYPLPPDPRMGPWSLNHVTRHQWLIPVMSHSEGLVYKPYPGPGPPGSTQIIGHNFVNHGTPPPGRPNYPWPTGFYPMVPVPTHGYFPPFSMTTMSEETNPFNMRYQGSSNIIDKFHRSSNSGVQVSTASSPSDRTQNQDGLPSFATCPPAEGVAEPTRVIRVVPRKAHSATESVARIFRSIQEERKQV